MISACGWWLLHRHTTRISVQPAAHCYGAVAMTCPVVSNLAMQQMKVI